MDQDDSHLLRNAAIGAGAAVGGGLIFAGLRKYWWVIAATLAYNHLAYVFSDEPKRDAVIQSFERDQVTLSGVTPVMDGSTIFNVRAQITNRASARISNVQLNCSFNTMAGQASSTVTKVAYGFVAPGETKAIDVLTGNNGALSIADLDTFKCTPIYDIEKADLFKAKNRSDIDLLSRLSVDYQVKQEVVRYDSRVVVTGTIANPTDQTVKQLDVLCHVDRDAGTGVHTQSFAILLEVKPNQGERFIAKGPWEQAYARSGGYKYFQCSIERAR